MRVGQMFARTMVVLTQFVTERHFARSVAAGTTGFDR